MPIGAAWCFQTQLIAWSLIRTHPCEAGADAGNSVVSDLEKLGASSDVANDFADLDTLDDPTAASTSNTTSAKHPAWTIVWSKDSDKKIHVYAAAAFYHRATTSNDKYYSTKTKISAWSSDTSSWLPDRVTKARVSTLWGTRNSVYDYGPDSPQDVGSCRSVTVSASGQYGGVSESSNVCPDKPDAYGPYIWSDGPSSGGVWTGWEDGTHHETAPAVQSVQHTRGYHAKTTLFGHWEWHD